MPSLRTEKAIQKVIDAKAEVSYSVNLNRNGNHAISFFTIEPITDRPKRLARFTLRQIIGKRYPAKKKK